MAGEEVVQLYVSALGSSVERAPLELKAFARVALAPGERWTLQFTVPVADLAWYDESRGWVVEPIEYEIIAARHAEDEAGAAGAVPRDGVGRNSEAYSAYLLKRRRLESRRNTLRYSALRGRANSAARSARSPAFSRNWSSAKPRAKMRPTDSAGRARSVPSWRSAAISPR